MKLNVYDKLKKLITVINFEKDGTPSLGVDAPESIKNLIDGFVANGVPFLKYAYKPDGSDKILVRGLVKVGDESFPVAVGQFLRSLYSVVSIDEGVLVELEDLLAKLPASPKVNSVQENLHSLTNLEATLLLELLRSGKSME